MLEVRAKFADLGFIRGNVLWGGETISGYIVLTKRVFLAS